MIGLEIFIACAPNVAPATIEQIITVESAGDPLAINVNGGRLERKPESPADAAKMVYQYIANGHSVDMGLMQVNSRNLAALGYTVEEMFEPCTNISAGSRVLTQFYSAALRDYPDQQRALTAALSAYNTGNFIKGFENGYLARYGIHAQQAPVSVPAITPQSADTVVFVREKQEATPMSNTDVQTVAVVSQDAEDGNTPGVQIEHDAQQAEENGAFVEDAIDEDAAWQSNADLAPQADPHDTAIIVSGKPYSSEGQTP